MQNIQRDGELQVKAGFRLLQRSCLVTWSSEKMKFLSVEHDEFTSAWKRLDPEFGRLICWILFSAGAEMFAKGVCLVNGIDFRKRNKKVPAYPPCPDENSMCDWAHKYLKNWKDCGVTRVTVYGTLRNLITGKYPKREQTLGLPKLLDTCEVASPEKDLVLATYDLLAKSIRNRDAHAYVPDVRDSHFYLVKELFARSLTILAKCLPDGPTTLNAWIHNG